MALYLITSKHEPQECLRALDEGLEKRSLDKFVYGCKGGDHTGYAIVDVKSVSEALTLVPDFLQDKACVSKVDKFTRGEVKSLHTKAA
jgi:hypothetical protein